MTSYSDPFLPVICRLAIPPSVNFFQRQFLQSHGSDSSLRNVAMVKGLNIAKIIVICLLDWLPWQQKAAIDLLWENG